MSARKEGRSIINGLKKEIDAVKRDVTFRRIEGEGRRERERENKNCTDLTRRVKINRVCADTAE